MQSSPLLLIGSNYYNYCAMVCDVHDQLLSGYTYDDGETQVTSAI